MWSLWKIVGTTFLCIIVLHEEKVLNSIKSMCTQDLKAPLIHIEAEYVFHRKKD